MHKFLSIVFVLFFTSLVFAQDIRVFHGYQSESVFLKQNDRLDKVTRETLKIVRGTDGVVTIAIMNPNPFLYQYELKTEDIELKDPYSDQFSAVVKLISAMPEIADNFKGVAARVGPPSNSFEVYQAATESVDGQIMQAKNFIVTSDHPESIEEAFTRKTNPSGHGFRTAIELINRLSGAKANFNSRTLEKDLNDLLDAAIADGSFNTELSLGAAGADVAREDFYKRLYRKLNQDLASSVAQIRALTTKDRILRFVVPVKANKNTKVRLVITKKDPSATVLRETFDEEVATIFPYYERKMFQVVPVVNLVFQANRPKYTLENGIVTSVEDDEAKFNIGAMAVMNFASFGEFREFGVGMGVGYSLQPGGKAESFFALPSLSYKDAIRFGVGFGYVLSPAALKNGGKIGSPLPGNIANIEDVIVYRRKLGAVFSLAIAGLKF